MAKESCNWKGNFAKAPSVRQLVIKLVGQKGNFTLSMNKCRSLKVSERIERLSSLLIAQFFLSEIIWILFEEFANSQASQQSSYEVNVYYACFYPRILSTFPHRG